MNQNIMKQTGFAEETELFNQGRCPFCKLLVRREEFRDALSRREFEISGLCQACQDDVFTEPTE